MRNEIENSSDYYGYHFCLSDFNRYMTTFINQLINESKSGWFELEEVIHQFNTLNKNETHNTYLVDNLPKLNQLINFETCWQHNIQNQDLVKRLLTVLKFCTQINIRSN